MINKEVTCPKCGHSFYYWTLFDFVTCTNCLHQIPVEPCVEDIEVTEPIEGD